MANFFSSILIDDIELQLNCNYKRKKWENPPSGEWGEFSQLTGWSISGDNCILRSINRGIKKWPVEFRFCARDCHALDTTCHFKRGPYSERYSLMPLSECYYDRYTALCVSSNIHVRKWVTAENLREFRHARGGEGHWTLSSGRTRVSSKISGIRRIPSIHLRNV